jgi:tmRNA-binding protein
MVPGVAIVGVEAAIADVAVKVANSAIWITNLNIDSPYKEERVVCREPSRRALFHRQGGRQENVKSEIDR